MFDYFNVRRVLFEISMFMIVSGGSVFWMNINLFNLISSGEIFWVIG